MKKSTIAILLFAAFLMNAAPAMAVQRDTPEYQRMVEIKKAQREKRAQERANPTPKAKGFWSREAERSGLAGTAAMVTHAADRVIPGQQGKETR